MLFDFSARRRGRPIVIRRGLANKNSRAMVAGRMFFLSPAFGPDSALFGNLPSAISKPLPAKFGMGSFISCENFRFCAVVFCVLGDSDFLKFLYASSGKFRPAFFFYPLKIPLNCERGGQTRRARRVPAKCALVRLKSSFATIRRFFRGRFRLRLRRAEGLARCGFAGNLCAPKETFFGEEKLKIFAIFFNNNNNYYYCK